MFFLLEIWAHHHDLQSKHSTKGPFIKDVDPFFWHSSTPCLHLLPSIYPSVKFNEFWCLPHPFKLQTFFMDGPQLNSPCERATLLLSFVKFDMVTRNDRASFPWIVTIHFFLEKKRRVRYLRQSYLHQNIKREFKFPEKNDVENDTLSLQKGCDKLSSKINMKRKYNCGSGKLISPWHFFFWYQIFYIVVTFSKEGIWFVVACCWLEHHS